MAQARKTTENIHDFLMNEFEDDESSNATPVGSRQSGSPTAVNRMHSIYARTLKRRGPGRPRVRPEVFRP